MVLVRRKLSINLCGSYSNLTHVAIFLSTGVSGSFETVPLLRK